MRLSTRKEARKSLDQLSWRHIPTWGGRTLIADTPKGEIAIGGGIISRIIVDLKTPSQFIINWARV